MILITLCSHFVPECWCLDTEHEIVLRSDTALSAQVPFIALVPGHRFTGLFTFVPSANRTRHCARASIVNKA